MYSIRLPVIPLYLLRQFQVEDVSDTRFRSSARLLQSMWREDQNLPIGYHQQPNEHYRFLGSRIDVPSAMSGRNFLSPQIARLVKYETVYREVGALIEEDRLWQNLLSSQSLCFNLFGEMKLDRSIATRFWSRLFPEQMADVESIYFEHSPGRGDESFIADHTAFDVMIVGKNRKGQRAFIAIEVKYSESMNEPLANLRPRYDEVSANSDLYFNPDESALRSSPLQQLWREHMLCQTMLDNGLYERGLFLVIYPEKNEDCANAVSKFRQHLKGPREGKSIFAAVTLEDCIKELREIGEGKSADALFARYLDFDRIEEAIFEPQDHSR
jgi:hypothetical protein